MKTFVLATVACLAAIAAPAFADSPIVLELFTSQSCSSCPPADALLQSLSTDPRLLPLSFHVTYWDGPDWRDAFSLAGSTDRQKSYEAWLKQNNVYTPELVVDGTSGMVGSNRSEVAAAIEAARARPKPVTVSMTPSADRRHLSITFAGAKPGAAKDAEIWLVTFSPKAVTAVNGGENSGSQLTSINNVTDIKLLARSGAASLAPLQIDLPADPAENYAVLVQSAETGVIIGAGSYLPVRP